MAKSTNNYSQDRDTDENFNYDDKYSVTGESEFSRESTIPYDEDEVLSERHYTFGPLENISKKRTRSRESRSEPYTRTSFRGKGPKGYRRSDQMIHDDVGEALYRSSEVDASNIEVFVERGVVTLKGFVADRDQKKMAEATVENLTGVEDIYNEIRVRGEPRSIVQNKNGLIDNITGLN
jgi:osmotically-inducible protein OsmY